MPKLLTTNGNPIKPFNGNAKHITDNTIKNRTEYLFPSENFLKDDDFNGIQLTSVKPGGIRSESQAAAQSFYYASKDGTPIRFDQLNAYVKN